MFANSIKQFKNWTSEGIRGIRKRGTPEVQGDKKNRPRGHLEQIGLGKYKKFKKFKAHGPSLNQ